MTGKLSTHVLDTVNGCAARNMQIELWAIANNEQKNLLKTLYTNQDGRTDQPLLSYAEMQVGVYELWFHVSDYFANFANNIEILQSQPTFLSLVPIRFGISDVNASYHVPLLVSPWAYSTYRGS